MAFALHPEAIEDLAAIHQYIETFNATAADRTLDELFTAFDSFARMPRQGFRRPELTSRPLRFHVVRSFLIAYAPDHEPLWIVAVIDGRRNPRVMAAILHGRE